MLTVPHIPPTEMWARIFDKLDLPISTRVIRHNYDELIRQVCSLYDAGHWNYCHYTAILRESEVGGDAAVLQHRLFDSRGGRKSKSVRTVDKQFREASAVSTPSGGNPYTPST